MRALGLIFLVMLLTLVAACDECSCPGEDDEGFSLTVMVTDTLGQPLEGLRVWRQSHLEGTFQYLPLTGAATRDNKEASPASPDSLRKIFPNPFNGVCSISYLTSDIRQVRLDVSDWRGRHVRTVVAGVEPEGMHEVQWDQRDDSGDRVMTGVYTMKLTLNDTLDTHLFTYSAERKCTVYDDFFMSNYIRGWSLGETDTDGLLSVNDLDYFPCLQGHEDQVGYDQTGDWLGIFWFDEKVTVRVSTVPATSGYWVYFMSRDIDLEEGPNYVEFAFEPEDSMEIPDWAR